MERLMTAAQVANYAQVNVQTIYRKVRSGDLPHYRIGTALRFKQDEIESAIKGGNYAKKGETGRKCNPVNSF